MRDLKFPRIGLIMLDTYSKHYEQRIEVIRETPKRYLVRAIKRTRLVGIDKWLEAGATKYVPKELIAVRLRAPKLRTFDYTIGDYID